ncbi:uncharacterized protein LOC123203974 isoform X2 [Mangifera indica]|uniref:uncharacterized protein LOC123203974 isoform X2 n=1 Tax=Mangifera indica TaxID=29780 RepID=UPI001CF99D54|nr:uncharacterized protein LOC123203974 isoform X2 [Mangifera indica]
MILTAMMRLSRQLLTRRSTVSFDGGHVLICVDPESSHAVVGWAAKTFSTAVFFIYEQSAVAWDMVKVYSNFVDAQERRKYMYLENCLHQYDSRGIGGSRGSVAEHLGGSREGALGCLSKTCAVSTLGFGFSSIFSARDGLQAALSGIFSKGAT